MLPIRRQDSAPPDLLRVKLRSDPPGLLEISGQSKPVVSIHVGRPVRLACKHGDHSHVGLAIHGDIEILPAGMPASWELQETDTALLLIVPPNLLRQVAEESGLDTLQLELRSRFQIRDPQIEHIGWALKAEVEQGYPSGNLFLDSMATALAIQLLRHHSSLPGQHALRERGLSPDKCKQVLSYIEDNLREKLSLQAIASAAGLSGSHLKALFRRSLGMPIHQYVIRRRVERAALLLRQGRSTISQIAIETGFAHQSHLAMHVRRILGVSPSELGSISRENRDLVGSESWNQNLLDRTRRVNASSRNAHSL